MKNVLHTFAAAAALVAEVATAPFRAPSIDAIVGDVEKRIDRLMSASQRHADTAVNHEAKAYKLRQKAANSRNEALRGARIASRLNNLFS